LFCSNPNAELIVRLSDQPEADADNLPDIHNVEVARIRPPDPGSPGAIGSSEFADFFLVASRGSLDLTRGSFIEVVLACQGGACPCHGACCLIDEFDPFVQCSYTCADLNGDNAVSNADYLYALGDQGLSLSTGNSKWCLDNKFNSDHFVDAGDLAGSD